MADTYTSSLRVRLQADGANDSTWGSLLNTAALQLLEDAIAGRVSVTHDDTANDTLTTANGSTDEARRMIVDIGGALSANRNMVVPTQAKFYVIKNSTTGGYSVTVKTTAGTGVAVPNGKTMMLFCDGTNVVESINQVVGNFAVGGTLGVTGATTLSAALTYGGVTLSNAVTGTGNMVLSTSPTLVTPLLGTPTSGVLTNCTGLPIAGTTGYGTGVATALAVNVGSAGAFLTFNGDAGTPSALVGTNISGTAASLTAGAVAASGITGTTLAANVVASSLTSVGTLTSLNVSGAVTLGDNVADALVVTTNAMSVTAAGEVTHVLQPAFAARKNATTTNVTGTGAGSAYTVIFDVEIFDQNADYDNATGIFTAPVTGRYTFQAGVYVTGNTVATAVNMNLVTSNRTWLLDVQQRAASADDFFAKGSVTVDMDAGDTAYVSIYTTGEAGNTADVFGSAGPNTYFSGFLAC